MRQILHANAMVLLLFAFNPSSSQTVLTYNQRVENYYSSFTTGTAGSFNEGSYQVGMYANGDGTKQVVLWRKFRTDASGSNSSNRNLQIGDQIVITLKATRAYGKIGFALLSNPTSVSSWNDKENNFAISLLLDGPAYNGGHTWYAKYKDNATSVGSDNVTATTDYKNFTFTLTLVANDRMNLSWTDGVTTSNLYDVLLNTSTPITDYSIFLDDDYNGSSNKNIYWGLGDIDSQHRLTNTGNIVFGQSNGSFTVSSITNGLDANSNSINSLNNNLTKNGSGVIAISEVSTYLGLTDINNGILELQNDLASSTITIASGAKLRINGDNVDINNLTINSGGILEILPGKSLTVAGTLTNNAGNTGIVIKSDATGTGSLITANNVGATVERYVAGDWSSATSGWHQISSPVAAQALSAFETSGTNNGYDLYGWDESTNTWKNYKDADFATWNGSANFNVGQGYMISYEANQTKTFSGALNVSDVTLNNLSNTGGFWYTGWHLLGNPFSSAVQWNNGSWALTDVAGTCKIWNSTSKSYSDIAANGIIPSAQGFMIKVADATNSITIPASARVHNSTNWYKSGNQTEKFLLIAAEQSGLSAQESQILVNPDATPEYDFDFDSHFLAGYAPQFYSIAGDIKLSTNTLPSLPDDAIIPFGFVKNEATQFSITMQEQISGYIVYLNDLITGVEHNLTDQPVYSFTSSEGDDPNRFLLYFAPVSVNKPAQSNVYGIYSYAGQVYISNTPSNAQITLSNLTGQVVMQRNTGVSGLVTLNSASLPKGVYIVTVQGEGARVSRKIVL